MLEAIPTWGWFIIGTAVAAGITYLMLKFPLSRAWVRKNVVEVYNYLDSIKDSVPVDLKPSWQATYDEADAIIDALGDDKITLTELIHMTTHALELVASIRKIIGV